MEARIIRAALIAAVLFVSMGARHRSANFIIETPDPTFAKQVSQAAERYRHDLAVEWLGQAMPNWSQPCVMTVRTGANLGAGGATTFMFDRGEVFGWRMSIQGSRERLLDSVLPHEITHMVFASHFRRPLPRWADEGGATSVEHISERNKYRKMLYKFLQTGRGIAFNRMFAMKDYPPDVMPLYAQGYSLAEFLIGQHGRRKYVEFMGEGLNSNDWSGALRRCYGISNTAALQKDWLKWVCQGSPPLRLKQTHPATVPTGDMLASAANQNRPEPNPVRHIPAIESPPYAPGSVTPAFGPAPTDHPIRLVSNNTSPSPKQLPATGWRAVGSRPSPKSVAAATSQPSHQPEPAVRSHVTRPQPIERSRQIILEWSSR